MTYFEYLPFLSVDPYTNYFLNTFMPSHDFDTKQKTYIQYFRKDFYNDVVVIDLENTLKKYRFPSIDYFSIFRHTKEQTIHHDGTKIPRYASLNLPLSGFKSTKMIFYKIVTDSIIEVTDANYYLPDRVEPFTELAGSSKWVLVNSSVPHNISNVNPDDPRITLCIRFVTNPTIMQLLSKLNGPA